MTRGQYPRALVAEAANHTQLFPMLSRALAVNCGTMTKVGFPPSRSRQCVCACTRMCVGRAMQSAALSGVGAMQSAAPPCCCRRVGRGNWPVRVWHCVPSVTVWRGLGSAGSGHHLRQGGSGKALQARIRTSAATGAAAGRGQGGHEGCVAIRRSCPLPSPCPCPCPCCPCGATGTSSPPPLHGSLPSQCRHRAATRRHRLLGPGRRVSVCVCRCARMTWAPWVRMWAFVFAAMARQRWDTSACRPVSSAGKASTWRVELPMNVGEGKRTLVKLTIVDDMPDTITVGRSGARAGTPSGRDPLKRIRGHGSTATLP